MKPGTDFPEHFALFDTAEGGGLLLTGLAQALVWAGDPDSFFSAAEQAAAGGAWVALAADYALGACYEPAAPRRCDTSVPVRGWVFRSARRLASDEFDGLLSERLAALPENVRVAGVAEVKPRVTASEHADQVARVQHWITEGDCYQINLTFPIDFRYFGHPLALYAALRRRQPVRYGAYIAVPEGVVLSLSPELFFSRTGQRVMARPMKGTAPRGATPEDDACRRAALLASAKERAENVMIVDLLRNDLGRLAAPGAVRVEALCEAEAYPTVWQVVSTVCADLPDVALAALFRSLFPCGSITGAPKIRAMQCIDALEEAPRGLYTGAIGWLAPGGDCRFNVAIRTPELLPGGRGRLGVGGGIVIDAQAAAEYAECLLKARFLTGLDPGFQLIETLRLENGMYPLLPWHLARLQDSAQALGFQCDTGAVRALLEGRAAALPPGGHRVRLTLAHDGSVSLTTAPLAEGGGVANYAVLSDEVLDPDDYLLRHKTTARFLYDRALAALADRPEIFDAIFLNHRGEVCEGARSNVFVERNGVLLTPPLSCGLLPGVLRQSLIDSGRAVEQVLTPVDLVGPFYLGNALRGLVPMRLTA